jgi:hypothetical protein
VFLARSAVVQKTEKRHRNLKLWMSLGQFSIKGWNDCIDLCHVEDRVQYHYVDYDPEIVFSESSCYGIFNFLTMYCIHTRLPVYMYKEARAVDDYPVVVLYCSRLRVRCQ